MPNPTPAPMTVSQQISYYVNLLAIQYKVLANAQGTIQALATQGVASQIYSQVLNGFSLTSAVGAQLNILADYVGAPREIFEYSPSYNYFTLTPYADIAGSNIGFQSYTNASLNPGTQWLSYTTSETTYVLTDPQLQQLIQYMIALHMNPHTINSIDLLLQQFFGNYCTLTDNMNMSITYTHLLADPGTLFGIVNELGLLPHPAGVKINIVQM